MRKLENQTVRFAALGENPVQQAGLMRLSLAGMKENSSADMGFSGKIVVIGNSHAQAIKTAAQECGGKVRGIPVEVYKLHRKESTAGTDLSLTEARELLASLSENDLAVSIVGGNHFNIIGLIEHSRPFYVWGPHSSEDVCADERQVIPVAVMRSILEEAITGERKALRQLANAASCPLIHLEAPPPKGDNLFVERSLAIRETQRFDLGMGIAPPKLRLHLWKIQSQLLRDLCGKLSVRFLEAPEQALDEKGFLKRDYYNRDATHANAAYGALVLDGIVTKACSDHVSEVAGT